MPEHLRIRKELTALLFKNKFLESLTRTHIFIPVTMHSISLKCLHTSLSACCGKIMLYIIIRIPMSHMVFQQGFGILCLGRFPIRKI